VISAGHAEHDSVRHLLESRYAAATVEVSEALRERVCRSIDNADVIEREVLAGFAAALDSYLRVAAHGRTRKLETASTGSTPCIICGAGLALAIAWYSWLEGLAATVRKYCRLRPQGLPAKLFFANQRKSWPRWSGRRQKHRKRPVYPCFAF